jgi:hypothetical protein
VHHDWRAGGYGLQRLLWSEVDQAADGYHATDQRHAIGVAPLPRMLRPEGATMQAQIRRRLDWLTEVCDRWTTPYSARPV